MSMNVQDIIERGPPGEDALQVAEVWRNPKPLFLGWLAVAVLAFVVSPLTCSDAGASRLATDFCSFGNLIVVGTVEAKRSFLREPAEDGRISTAFEFSVERVVLGPPLVSVELEADGGTVDGRQYMSSAGIHAQEGDRLLLILNQPADGSPASRILEWPIDPEVTLPDERELAGWWRALCSSCSEGYPDGFMTMMEFEERARAQREDRVETRPQPPLLEDRPRCEEHSLHLRQLGLLP